MSDSNYWLGSRSHRWSRRQVLRGAGVGSAGLLGAALIGCGSDDDGGGGGGGATSTPTNGGGGGATSTATAGPTQSSGEPILGGSITVAALEPPQFDPHLQAPSARVGEVMSHIYPSLTRYDLDHPDYAYGSTIVTSYLAENWEIPDNLTYVFKLRQGVVWDDREPTNGREIVAEDVKYSFDRFYASEFMAGVTPQPGPNIEVQDDYTLVFNLEVPYSQLLVAYGNQNHVIVPHEVEDTFGDFQLAENARGAGPFRVKEYVPGSRIVWEKNPTFMDAPRPYLDEVVNLFEVNSEAEIAAYRSGQFAMLPTIQVSQIDNVRSAVPDAIYEQRSGCCAQAMGTRMDMEPTSDIRVRQALSKALDRQTWLDQIYRGIGYLPISVYTDLWQEFTLPEDKRTDEARYNFEYNVDEAKSLLEAAGGFSGTQSMHVFPSPDPIWDQSATLAMDFISKIGVQSELVKKDYGAFASTTYRGDYDGLAWFPVGEFSPAGLLNRYTPGAAGRNVNHIDDPEINELLEKFNATSDHDEAVELCHQVQLRSAEQLLYVMGPYGHTFHSWQNWLKGYDGRTDTAYGNGYEFARMWVDNA